MVAGWYDLTFASPISLPAGTYWLGMISGSTSYVAAFRYSTVSGSRSYNPNSHSAGPTNPLGTASVDGELTSLYATYTLQPQGSGIREGPPSSCGMWSAPGRADGRA
ncbi:MAG: hypothetical protein NVS9B8_05220 [Candidatus Limnocylindrales bacterium]